MNVPMTLIERLLNPAWENERVVGNGHAARLNVKRTVADMREAADKIKQLKLHLKALVAHWDEFGPEHGFDECMHHARVRCQDDR